MLELENEDMVPRCAPKPSVQHIATQVLCSSVPEISIVFCERRPEMVDNNPPSAVSYAFWKDKCLTTDAYTTSVESSYTGLPSISMGSSMPSKGSEDGLITDVNAFSKKISNNEIKFTNVPTICVQKRNDTQQKTAVCCELPLLPNSSCKDGKIKNRPKCKSFLTTAVETKSLSISIGTQTDHNSDINDLATKKDITEMKSTILGLQTELHHLFQIIQLLLKEKVKPICQPQLNDFGTQYDQSVENVKLTRPNIMSDSIEEQVQTKEETYGYQHKSELNSGKEQKPLSNVLFGLPNSTSDQSMAMKELALKYLPNRNYHESLQDVIVRAPIQEQHESLLKSTETSYKNPTEFSTATYKYLRKYRLLPEENENFNTLKNLLKLRDVNKKDFFFDLETIRHKPKFI